MRGSPRGTGEWYMAGRGGHPETLGGARRRGKPKVGRRCRASRAVKRGAFRQGGGTDIALDLPRLPVRGLSGDERPHKKDGVTVGSGGEETGGDQGG